MPRNRNEEFPLPAGWAEARDFDGKVYYIDHNKRQTSWIDPRDRLTKPQTFADCVGNELPFGWEEVFDPHLGLYYVDHINKKNQIDDPRQEWRQAQEKMLKEYLVTAQDDLHAKQEIYAVKQQRLALAQDEFQHLNSALHGWQSRTSLCSSGSSGSTTKYDPELLKQEVNAAKHRVAKLKNELEQVKTEVHYKERGVATLQHVDEKMSNMQAGYKLSDAQAILAEIRSIQKSINSGEREKADLMKTIGRLKSGFGTSISAPDISISTTSLSSIAKEKTSTSSQTDLTGDFPSSGARLAEKAKLKLQYEEARRRLTYLQIQLAEIENKELPGQHEADKDRILLIQEKEQLLKELRKVNPRKRSEDDMKQLEAEKQRLAREIIEAKEQSHKLIGDRLKLEEKKKECLQQLAEATQLITYLENQLKSISASTLSISSSSSRGSLSAASSKGSLASSKNSLNISFTDIYGLQQINTADIEIRDLKEKVDALLQGGGVIPSLTIRGTSISPIHETSGAETSESSNASLGLSTNKLNTNGTPKSLTSLSPVSSFSSLSPPASPGGDERQPVPEAPPPSYQEHFMNLEKQKLEGGGSAQINMDSNEQIANLSSMVVTTMTTTSQYVPSYQQTFSQSVSDSRAIQQGIARLNLESKQTTTDYNVDIGNQPLSPISESIPGVGTIEGQTTTTTRSVSAAISDESVAGDSGVYEAAIKRPGEMGDDVFFNDADMYRLEAAQVQIGVKYDATDSLLHISVEQARNLNALPIPDKAKVYIKIALYPASTNSVFSTKLCEDNIAAVLNEVFKVPLQENQLTTKTIQVNVWSVNENKEEDCLGGAQVSLADFNPMLPARTKWYNILNFKYLQTESRKCSGHTSLSDSPNSISSNNALSNDRVAELLEASSSRLRRASTGDRIIDEIIQTDKDDPDSRFRSSSFDTSNFRHQQQQYVPVYSQDYRSQIAITEQQQRQLYMQLQQQQQQQLYQEQQQQQLYQEQQQQLYSDQQQQLYPDQQQFYAGQLQQQLYTEQIQQLQQQQQQQQLYSDQQQQQIQHQQQHQQQQHQLYSEQLQQQQLYTEHQLHQQQLYAEQLQQQLYTEHMQQQMFYHQHQLQQQQLRQHASCSALANLYEQANYQNHVNLQDPDFSQTWLCDKETNTDELKANELMRSGKNTHHTKTDTRGNLRTSNIVRSATFSPGPQKHHQYICRLNRSDSDSSMLQPMYRRGPFIRNSLERRSLRWKKGPKIPQLQVEHAPQRTSLDLELDLQASITKQNYLHEEIARLKAIKLKMEEAQENGMNPAWLSEHDILKKLLEDADAVNKREGKLQDRNERSLKKATKQVYKLRQSQTQQPEIMSFREKMAFFTTVNVHVPTLPKN